MTVLWSIQVCFAVPVVNVFSSSGVGCFFHYLTFAVVCKSVINILVFFWTFDDLKVVDEAHYF
jgi:hypothetical protein